MSKTQPSVLPLHPDVEIVSTDRVWDGRCPLDIVRFRHRRFDGTMSDIRTWELWRRGVAMAVLPYDPSSDAVVLLEQFRLPALAAGVSPVMTEIPAGFAERGETPDETARRECAEEIGLVPDRLEPIGEFVLTPGGCDERIGLYAGRVHAPAADACGLTTGGGGLAAEHEDIRVRVWPAEAAIAAAVAGEIPNSVAALGLLWLGLRRGWLRNHWRDGGA
jgi:ADP-ribose pyrophosphatase